MQQITEIGDKFSVVITLQTPVGKTKGIVCQVSTKNEAAAFIDSLSTTLLSANSEQKWYACGMPIYTDIRAIPDHSEGFEATSVVLLTGAVLRDSLISFSIVATEDLLMI